MDTLKKLRRRAAIAQAELDHLKFQIKQREAEDAQIRKTTADQAKATLQALAKTQRQAERDQKNKWRGSYTGQTQTDEHGQRWIFDKKEGIWSPLPN